ncbi:hypothetical protein GCM10010211_82900 [Streptomyces albospinus]|uniref:LysR substrate-binding domain-containing protein n=1 Tax=Streptomyces albospinus TaxID=285515 RepID=A0ABQ2VPH8_9ACTN|nr:LysR substrate-binding domain-containing protein [Streptomyces albospinus]GGV03077.1 hypothetical protein GCM10010211_82900 [Streptomyces albospinus]
MSGAGLPRAFQGTADDRITRAVDAFHTRHPRCATEIVEIPLRDPFGALRSSAVDLAVALLTVTEPDPALDPGFSAQQQPLALSVRHPLASRAALGAEGLAALPLFSPGGPAPAYRRTAHAPRPRRPPDPRRPPTVSPLQEGLALAAAGRGGMLLCRPTADHHPRREVAFVPVTGLPDSVLGRGSPLRPRKTARVRAFGSAVTAATATAAGTGEQPGGGANVTYDSSRPGHALRGVMRAQRKTPGIRISPETGGLICARGGS